MSPHLDGYHLCHTHDYCPQCEVDRLRTLLHSKNKELATTLLIIKRQQDTIQHIEAALLQWRHGDG